MKSEIKISLGLLFEQAILFGFLFVFVGGYGFYNIFENLDFNKIYLIHLILSVLCLITILVGLVPILSKKYVIISNLKNQIIIRNQILFIFKSEQKSKLNDFDFLFLGNAKRQYSSGGGFLPTAKNFSTLNEIDLYFYNSNNNTKLVVKNVGSSKKAERIFNQILENTNLKTKA